MRRREGSSPEFHLPGRAPDVSWAPRLALADEAGACRDGCPEVSASLTSGGWPTRPSHTQLKSTIEPNLSFASKPGLIIYVSHLIGSCANQLHFPLWCLRVVAPRPEKWVHPVKRKCTGEPLPSAATGLGDPGHC